MRRIVKLNVIIILIIITVIDCCCYNFNIIDTAATMIATAAASAATFVAVPHQNRHKFSNENNAQAVPNDHQRLPSHHLPQHNLIPSQIYRSKNNQRTLSKATTNLSMMPSSTTTSVATGSTGISSTGSSSSIAFVTSENHHSQDVSQQQRLLPRHHTQQQSRSNAASSAISRSPPPPLYATGQPTATTATTTTTATATDPISTTDGNLKRGRRRNRTQRKKRASMAEKKASAAAAATTTTTTTTTTTIDYLSFESDVTTNNVVDNSSETPANKAQNMMSTGTYQFPTSGNLPDIYWRSIPMEHLRHHPNFIALPEPNTIRHLHTIDDVKNFRQESWQWDTLHHGRCTTSQAVAALGFLEAKVGEELGVPLSWRRGGTGAFVRLCVTPLRTLEEMNEILIVPNDHNSSSVINAASTPVATTTTSTPSQISTKKSSVWLQQTTTQAEINTSVRKGFAANYQYRITTEQQQDRKKYARKISQNENMSKSIRMMWGNTQEATALLTAINYFTKLDPDFRLEEVGMCGAGLSLNITSSLFNSSNNNNTATEISSSLLIGATPDGILRHSNGLIEVLEVKNHCPFFSNSFHGGKGTKNRGGVRKRFTLSSLPFDDKSNGVFAHYVPQLQLEMLCVGPECQSAVMIRQTATAGAIILRMHRDNEWIKEMLYWLHRFQIDFVEAKKPPPKNFFWDSPNLNDRARYRRFANKTKEIRNSRVELVARIHNDEIQRMGDHTSLFLD